jgi:gamma-tubulin complex component 5
MASTTTMTAWSEELARSFMPNSAKSSKLQRHVDRFNRMLKSHAYARTNQFEVEDKLNGLEEKFHVLHRQDIANALHKRHAELVAHQYRWLPDALDLLLHLSHHPLKFTRTEGLEDRHDRSVVPATLKWSEIDDQDSIDRKGELWKLPSFSDDDSDDDVGSHSSLASSPRRPRTAEAEAEASLNSLVVPTTNLDVSNLLKHPSRQGDSTNQATTSITEVQLVREVLIFAQGLPTSAIGLSGGHVTLNASFQLSHLAPESLQSALTSLLNVRKAAEILDQWSNQYANINFMQVLTHQLQQVLEKYRKQVSSLQSQHLRTMHDGGVVSVLRTIDDLHSAATTILNASDFVKAASDQDAVGCIDVLYEHTCRLEQVGTSDKSQPMTEIFNAVFDSYCADLDQWIFTGRLDTRPTTFFIQRAPDQQDRARLWESWYSLSESGPNRPPLLLRPLQQPIFRCGKTLAFARILNPDASTSEPLHAVSDIIQSAANSTSNCLTPFAATLAASLEQYIHSRLQQATALLQHALQTSCDLTQTHEDLSKVYLAEAHVAFNAFDTRLFTYLDRCQSTWNDRFLITDLLSEQLPDLDTDRIVVHAESVPSSTLSTVRRSADALANIAFDYLLPWPVANIILPETLASYRRVSLLLMQIRRAKYVLERRAYPRIRLLASNARSPSLAQIQSLQTTLLIFTTTLYSHLTSCVISPLTSHLHSVFASVPDHSTSANITVDDLIAYHNTYLRNLEASCLTIKNLKVLKDTLTSLLDLCLEFAFTLSDAFPSPSSIEAEDVEDEIEEVGGKVRRLKVKFDKGLDLLVAGLRGVARSVGANDGGLSLAMDAGKTGGERVTGLETWSQADTMGLLADSLESALINYRRRRR